MVLYTMRCSLSGTRAVIIRTGKFICIKTGIDKSSQPHSPSIKAVPVPSGPGSHGAFGRKCGIISARRVTHAKAPRVSFADVVAAFPLYMLVIHAVLNKLCAEVCAFQDE